MRTFKIKVVETLSVVCQVEADNYEEALEKVKQSKVEPQKTDCESVEYYLVNDSEIPQYNLSLEED